MINKFIAVFLVLFGESLAVLAEMLGAKNHFKTIIIPILLMVVAGIMLVFGYKIGITAFKNIWIITAVSITGLVITEPVMAMLFFNHAPTHGAIVGLVLGITGLITAMVW